MRSGTLKEWTKTSTVAIFVDPRSWWKPGGHGAPACSATSLGPEDACFVLAANENKGSGYLVNWSVPAAIQKELIESTKVDECKDNVMGKLVWHFVHHTP